jgi:hypothetical protein
LGKSEDLRTLHIQVAVTAIAAKVEVGVLPQLVIIAVMIIKRSSLLIVYKIAIRGEKEIAIVAKGVKERIKKQITK